MIYSCKFHRNFKYVVPMLGWGINNYGFIETFGHLTLVSTLMLNVISDTSFVKMIFNCSVIEGASSRT